MRCLICVSLGDVLGDVFYHALLFTTADLRLIVSALSKPTFEFWMTDYLWCEDRYRVKNFIGAGQRLS
jgi:hypothetical protein